MLECMFVEGIVELRAFDEVTDDVRRRALKDSAWKESQPTDRHGPYQMTI